MNEKIRINEDKNRIFFKSLESGPKKMKLKYPHIQDMSLQKKVSLKKEFQHFYESNSTKDIEQEERDEKLCNFEDFELAPHQHFVKSFISHHTPYNGLLLYHGMGSGKTCSSIGICEEYRKNNKYNSQFKKIIIIASPNVQENFKHQLVDPASIKQENGLWNIGGCVGNSLLMELHFQDLHKMSKEELVKKMNRFIKKHYQFIGYEKFANEIESKLVRSSKKKTKQNMRDYFEGRLIVVDEVHNIRMIEGNTKTKKIGTAFQILLKYVKHMKLLFLSGTPMYNDPKEIVFLLNLLNQNDGQSSLKTSDLFDKKGNLKEGGKEKLMIKANGYISYVRGENPFQFPFKVFPMEFDSDKSILNESNVYPSRQFNGKSIEQPIQHLDIYCNKLSPFQKGAYDKILQEKYNLLNPQEVEKYEESISFKYTVLREPLYALTLCVPDYGDESKAYIGKEALQSVMTLDQDKNQYTYNYETMRIFEYDKIGYYSAKIKTIMDSVLNSDGIVLIYSQFLEGGVIPVALALEELGLTRAYQSNLMDHSQSGNPKKIQSKYAMITGDVTVSKNNQKEINLLNNEKNKNGDLCKVVLITQTGSEGIDFKNLRQVHILEPWFNLNRVDQIIGRAIRNCSHRNLPLKKRNCQIYLHGSIDDSNVECADLMMYRQAEIKSQKIGEVQKVLKSTSVDCILNAAQNDFADMDQTIEIELSDKSIIPYNIRDKHYSSICDYGLCGHQCMSPTDNNNAENAILDNTYSLDHVEQVLRGNVLKEIKKLFLKGHVYKKKDIVANILSLPRITREHIDFALTYMIENPNEVIIDKFNRKGKLINIHDLYLFQPFDVEVESYLSLEDRMKPFESRTKNLQLEVQQKSSPINPLITEKPHEIIETIQKYYKLGLTLDTSEKQTDFYLLYMKTINELEELVPEIKLSEEQKELFLLHHILECIPHKKEKKLVEYLFKNTLNIFEEKIKTYYESFIYRDNDEAHTLLFLVDLSQRILKNTDENDKRITYVKDKPSNEEQTIWNKASSMDYHEIGYSAIQGFLDYKKPSTPNNIIGFMSFHDKKKSFHLKIKEINKNNTGAFFKQKIPKVMKEIINGVIGKDVIPLKKTKDEKMIEFSKEQLEVVMEIVLRYYHDINHNGKQYYMNKLEYSLIV